MAFDRVRTLKIEKPSTGGTQTDVYPTGIDPNEDAIDVRGVTLQNDSSDDEVAVISRDASNNMTFKDGANATEVTLSDLLESEGGGDDDQVDTIVAEGETFTVKADHQHIIYQQLTIEGDYVVDGEGVIFGGDEDDTENSVAVGDLESGTLAELNAAITDATLDDSSSTRAPSNHATNHCNGGCDELDHGLFVGLGDDDHTQYLKADGARGLSADWDAGSHKITAETLESDVSAGTAPFTVASTTRVTNLNADKLDDQEGSYYLSRTNHTDLHNKNAQTGTSYTLQSSDNGKLIVMTNAAAITLTVPSGLGADFACTIMQQGAGQVTITAGSGVTISNADSATKTEKQFAVASIIRYSTVAELFVTQGRLVS